MTREQAAAALRALIDISERCMQECEAAKRRGEKYGNYRKIGTRAHAALGYWTDAEIADVLGEPYRR